MNFNNKGKMVKTNFFICEEDKAFLKHWPGFGKDYRKFLYC